MGGCVSSTANNKNEGKENAVVNTKYTAPPQKEQPQAVVPPKAASAKPGINVADKPLTDAEQLVVASKTGDLEKVKKLNGKGVDLSTTDGGTNCAWHYAAANGHWEIVKYLQEKGCDVLSLPANGWGLIHYACYRGEKDAVVWVVDTLGGDVNLASVSGWTALHAACASGHINLVKWLLLKGSNPKCKTRKGRTVLHVALREGQLEMAQWLHSTQNMPLDERDRIGLTSVHQAAYSGRRDVVEWLLAKGLDVYAHDAYGWSVLYAAASTGEEDLIKLLNEKGCFLHITEKDPKWRPSRKPRVIKGDRRSIEAQKGGPQAARHSL